MPGHKTLTYICICNKQIIKFMFGWMSFVSFVLFCKILYVVCETLYDWQAVVVIYIYIKSVSAIHVLEFI